MEIRNVNTRKLLISFSLVALSYMAVVAQVPSSAGGEPRVPLTEQALAHDVQGRTALSARLRDTNLHGAPDSPVTQIRLVLTNTSPSLFTYVSGWATFYDSEGVRCGEGLFKVNALAPGESAETDAPGLRLVCSPATWRITATNLLTPTVDVAKPAESISGTSGGGGEAAPTALVQPLVLSIDGEEHPIQIGNPIVIRNGNKEIRLILKPAQ
jgi:hypothetical protein